MMRYIINANILNYITDIEYKIYSLFNLKFRIHYIF